MMDLKNKRVLVVGLGKSGLSAAMFLRKQGAIKALFGFEAIKDHALIDVRAAGDRVSPCAGKSAGGEFFLCRRHDSFPGAIQIALLWHLWPGSFALMWMLNYILHTLNPQRAIFA